MRLSTRLASLMVILPMAIALGGCPTSKVANAPNAVTSSASASGRDGFARTVYPFVRSKCVDCHGRARTPLFAQPNPDLAYDEAYTLVNFSEITGSKLVRKVKDGHCGGNCATDGNEMAALIQQWKDSYAKAAPLPGKPIPKGNVFTNIITVPAATAEYKARCQLPAGLACSPDITSGTGSCNNTCWVKLRFPVKQMTPNQPAALARAWFEADFAYENYASELGAASYVIKNPRVISPDAAIYVFDIKTFLNGNYRPEYGEAYRRVDTVVDVAKFGDGCTIPPAPTAFDPASIGNTCVPSVQPLFSTAASASGIVQETPNDTLGFSFEYFQEGVVGDCRDLTMFQNQVFNPIKIGAVGCLNCHKAGGQISEAGQRFNIDPNDTANGATDNARMQTICRRFLQRSNFGMPDNSPIVVQPRQGLNGMPAQENFNYFAPDWISWIEREKDLFGK